MRYYILKSVLFNRTYSINAARWGRYKQRYDRVRAVHRQIRLIYRLDLKSIGLSTLSSKLNDNMTVSKSIIANYEHMINCVKIEMQIIYLLFGQMYRSQTIFVLCIIHTICEEFCSEQFVEVVFCAALFKGKIQHWYIL